MLAATTGKKASSVTARLSPDDLTSAQALVRDMPIGEQIVDAILTLVRSARPTDEAEDRIKQFVSWGPGPRASQALSLTARAFALIEGRHAPSLDDIERLAKPVLRHRMALNFSARSEG